MEAKRKLIVRSILAIAFPSIITNITTPLLGMTDVAIAGHLGSAVFVSAIAVGSNMFNMLYWLFGFLRMGSSGLTAQKLGAGKKDEAALVLLRALSIALFFGLLFIVLSHPLKGFLLKVMAVEGETYRLTSSYFEILIWGAPAFLCSFALTGWLLGMQNSKTPMYISILTDIVNILASVILVFGFSLGIKGLAYGTLIAQWVGFIVCMSISIKRHRIPFFKLIKKIPDNDIFAFFRINFHIFLRTLLLVAVTLWFTRTGSKMGTDILAVNAIILQFFSLFSFFMDGFAYAGEALCGKFKGAADRNSFFYTMKTLLKISFFLSVTFSCLYFLFGESLVSLLSSDVSIIIHSKEYLWWAITIPLAGFMAFSFDGIFIGATETGAMLVSMAGATLVFFTIYFFTFEHLQNHGLWFAFIAYLLTRGLILWGLSYRFKKDNYFNRG